MFEPQIVLNWPAILVSAVVAFAIGGVWYGPLFGKTWGRGMGMDMSRKPDPAVIRRAMILQAVGLLLTAFVLAHTVQVWRPSVWSAGADAPDATYGFYNALFTWIGFYVPMQLSKRGWEERPWNVIFINMGHDFVNLLAMSMILAFWR